MLLMVGTLLGFGISAVMVVVPLVLKVLGYMSADQMRSFVGVGVAICILTGIVSIFAGMVTDNPRVVMTAVLVTFGTLTIVITIALSSDSRHDPW